MKGLIQRVRQARVEVAGEVVGAIDQGLLVLVGVEREDDQARADKLLDRLRLTPYADRLLLVSQFTLAADTRSGLRPSFSSAAPPAQGEALYDYLLAQARDQHPLVACGRFGAEMQVHLVNDGPVTFLLES